MRDNAGSGRTAGRWAERREYRVLQCLFSSLCPGVLTDCQSKTLTGNGKTPATAARFGFGRKGVSGAVF